MAILVYKCKKCGSVARPYPYVKYSFKCNNKKCGCTEYTTTEIPSTPSEIWNDHLYYADELVYLIDKIFNEIRPKQNDYIGCIELCEFIKEKYQLDNSVYELLGIINVRMYKVAHSENYYPIPYFPSVMLKDGRSLTYSYYFYRPTLKEDYEAPYTKEQMNAIDANPKKEIEKIICAIKAYKPYSFALVASDIDFSLYDMKLAREALKKKVDENLHANQVIANRNSIVKELTKPVVNNDPNYIKDANCPNCHKKYVYRISNVKRGASIGLFGLFSRDIGKTMECRSCGYKW